ncbi:MAG TPA: hypothetical protein VF256_05780 [Streptosporangiaceae bacterium]|jgi:hypothetical protein
MPDDNVWLAQRWADHEALMRLLETIRKPGRAIQGVGCGPAPAGPIPVTSISTSPKDAAMTDGARDKRTATLSLPRSSLGAAGPGHSHQHAPLTYRACT